MIHTIRVKTIIGPDLLGMSVLSDIHKLLNNNSITKVETTKVYRLEGISKKNALSLAEKLFCETINQTYTLNAPALTKTKQRIEIGYKPGVMNPEVGSILKSAQDLRIPLLACDSSHEYGFYGTVQTNDVKEIITRIKLFNPIIEHIIEKEPQTLQITGTVGPTTTIPLRVMGNNELMLLSKDALFLNLLEMQVIQQYFQKLKRDPTDCELETLAQTWSEHCAHKTFKANLIVNGREKTPLFTRLKTEALKHNKHIVSAFVDNAGVMDFYDGWALCGKAETHNSPSAIEPYGGAMTGSGGVFRDVVGTGQGAKAIASTDIFCLAKPDMDKNLLPEGCLPPDYMLKRVVAAVKDYGNRMGIPTNNGSFHFHNDFRAKPTVLVGAYGILPEKRAQKGTARMGDLVIALGGKTGRDGIHGATFSSGEMTNRTLSVNATAVQIGNAIEEKRVFDAIIDARDQGCIRALQDLGAGGFSSAIGEMGEKTGVSVDLQKVPVKYAGLSPWEIWISESQERMLACVPKAKLKTFLAICKKYNVETANLGTFDGTKKLRVFYGKKQIANLSMQFLHHGLPQRTMIAKKPLLNTGHSGQTKPIKSPQFQKDWLDTIEKVLAHPTICSKEPIVRLYDHSVQGTSVLQPYSGEQMDGPNDAAIVRPFLDKSYGMIVSHGLNPVLNSRDAYWGSIWAVTEALANYVAVGGDYRTASFINNYVWPFPDEESLYTLDQSVMAVVDCMRTFKIPVISGKDSLSSTYRGNDGSVLKIPPVLCMSVFGKIPDVRKTQTADFKKPESVIVLIGKQDSEAMEGSIYQQCHSDSEPVEGEESQQRKRSFAKSDLAQDDKKRSIPHPDLKHLPKLFQPITRGIQSGKILACHDISEGGLITALFEMCVGGDNGAEIAIPKASRPDFFLFNETAGTFLVEVASTALAKSLFHGLPYTILGKTQKEKTIGVSLGKNKLFTATLEYLKKKWQEPMKEYFK